MRKSNRDFMKDITIDEKVLNFYQEMPFNIYGDLKIATEKIKKNKLKLIYPELDKIIKNHKINNFIDIGCGGGWLVNTIAFNNSFKSFGLDFNPVALNYAKEVNKNLLLKSQFLQGNILEFQTSLKFDLITSLGVLHHTNDCISALKKVCKFGSKNSYIFLGLYHKYGRKPFLDFVKKIKKLNKSEMFEKYKELHKLSDKAHLMSWFRDQVLHPHETQHTYNEITPILRQCGYEIISTSINNFDKINSDEEIINSEKGLYGYGLKKMEEKKYFPGFFIIVGKKI